MLWALLAVLAALAVGVVFWPLWRRPAADARSPEERDRQRSEEEKQRAVEEIRRLEEDLAAGRITEADAEVLRQTLEARALEALAALEPASGGEAMRHPPRSEAGASALPAGKAGLPRRQVILGGVLVLCVLAGSGLLYRTVGGYALLSAPPGARAGVPPEMAAAVARLEEKLRAKPHDIEAQLLLARSYLALERSVEAAARYEQILKLDPQREEALLGLAVIRANEDRLAEAGKYVEQVLARNADHLEALWLRAMLLAEEGRYGEAETQLKRLSKRVPADSPQAGMIREALKMVEGKKVGSKE